jgi:predicted secreted protein
MARAPRSSPSLARPGSSIPVTVTGSGTPQALEMASLVAFEQPAPTAARPNLAVQKPRPGVS